MRRPSYDNGGSIDSAGGVLIWSAATCRRFIQFFAAVADTESGDKSPHSKLKRRDSDVAHP